ncbi:hypothetical protein Q31a_08460 [Aureliella helgolandensis]|uniref:Uncharacterized protein n=1 Tax=Aureliella helgolandensis TaxID=2527968 RepID=A0A518G1X9_9BACT|nr:hypothetical protein Q31a_08460 [Aureliella helgolandensis]
MDLSDVLPAVRWAQTWNDLQRTGKSELERLPLVRLLYADVNTTGATKSLPAELRQERAIAPG